MKTLSKNQQGFSLLELLVAVSILAIGLLAAISMQGVAMNSNAMANRISVGAMIAQEAIEDINSWPRNDARLIAGSNGAYNDGKDVYVPGSGSYVISYTITNNTPIAGVSRIDVRVEKSDVEAAGAADNLKYLSKKGEKRSVTMTTYRRFF